MMGNNETSRNAFYLVVYTLQLQHVIFHSQIVLKFIRWKFSSMENSES